MDGEVVSAGAVEKSSHIWLGRPIWQGVGAIIGLGSMLLTLAIACDEKVNNPADAKSGQVSEPPTQQQINGNCNGQGTDIQISCAAPPISRAGLSIYYPFLAGAIFAGSPDELPPPPDIPVTSARSHCEEWREWMDSNPRIYRPLALTLGISAGQQDLVAVKRVSVKIFRRTRMVSAIAIGCGHGGDGVYEGYTITVDTARLETIVQKGDSDSSHKMPPASVSLGEAGYMSVDVEGRSAPGYLYEGQVVIDAIVNGKEESILKGAVAKPFRWYGETISQDSGFYDWDFVSKGLSYYADETQYLEQVPE